MKFYEVERTIHASPAQVWAVLSNRERLLAAQVGITKIEGALRAGASFKLWSETSPGRAFPLRVVQWEPQRRMTWLGGMPLGMFRGERSFVLEPSAGAESTLFRMREEFSGWMLPLIWKSMPDLSASFELFAERLSAAAERGSRKGEVTE
jgi:hypothetical protein